MNTIKAWILRILLTLFPVKQPTEGEYISWLEEKIRAESTPQVWPTQAIEPPEQPALLYLPPSTAQEQPTQLPLYKHIEPIPVDMLLPPGMKRKTGDLTRAWHRTVVVPEVKTGELQPPPPDAEAFKDASWLNSQPHEVLPTLTSEQRVALKQLRNTPPKIPAVNEETAEMPAIKKLEMLTRTSQPGF